MKVIDIINGCLERDGTLPEKIMYKEKEFTFHTNRPYPHYYDTYNGVNFMSVLDYFQDLEEEVEIVEIIEEDKEIEELNLDTDKLRGIETPRAIDYLLESKINELVRELNELKKGK